MISNMKLSTISPIRFFFSTFRCLDVSTFRVQSIIDNRQSTILLALTLVTLLATAALGTDLRLPVDVRAELARANADFEDAQRIQTEDPQRARALYRSAAQRFESLISAGIESGPLEYNLGNCYLQAGDLGRAILHYRRAQRYMPNDPLLADNFREARSRRMTAIPPSRSSEFLKSVFFWHEQTTTSARTKAALALYAAFWLLITIRCWFARRWLMVTAVICGLLAAAAGASVAVDDWRDRNAPSGVLIAMDVPVYKGPGSGYQRQFEQPLQPGTEFTLRERRGQWWNIELPDGQTGWIESAAVELVVRPNEGDR